MRTAVIIDGGFLSNFRYTPEEILDAVTEGNCKGFFYYPTPITLESLARGKFSNPFRKRFTLLGKVSPVARSERDNIVQNFIRARGYNEIIIISNSSSFAYLADRLCGLGKKVIRLSRQEDLQDLRHQILDRMPNWMYFLTEDPGA